MQAIFEEANYLSLQNPDISFSDPLSDYFLSKDIGYNQPIINGYPITGTSQTPITFDEIEALWELEKDLNVDWWWNNSDYSVEPQITSNGVTWDNLDAYSKTQLMLKLRTALGNGWYNSTAIIAAELPFWYLQNVNSQITNDYNDPNKNLDPTNKWYFEFGRNGLPVPTGS